MGAIPKNNLIGSNCENRIKPSLLRDVKTEALLVFSRTALERYFAKLDQTNMHSVAETDEEAVYVYDTLRKFLGQLQESVVNADYLINVAHNAHRHPELRMLKKHEEPLMEYYDIMAQRVRSYYDGDFVYLPVFLVVSILAEWVLGEERSTHIYPFLNEIDFLELIGKFEDHREHFYHDGECKISEIHELSFKIVDKLKNHKYKANKGRVSKTRKKK
jgi:hypothetical protein